MKYRLFFTLSIISITTLSVGCASFQNNSDGRSQLERQAKHGDANSQYRIGLLYTNDTHQDYTKAAKWFRKSAQQGNRDAQYMLGISYYVGRGIPRDDKLARGWFQEAADQGHPRAQYQLGEMYMNGHGVGKEPDWAALWYGKAAEQRHADAQFSLGVAFASGLGLPVNRVRSCQWLMLAERSGHVLADAVKQKICSALSGMQQERAMNLANNWRPRDDSFYQDPPTLRYIQFNLQKLGYDPGYIDGVEGERTRDAVMRYLRATGDTTQTVSMKALLKRLRDASKA